MVNMNEWILKMQSAKTSKVKESGLRYGQANEERQRKIEYRRKHDKNCGVFG